MHLKHLTKLVLFSLFILNCKGNQSNTSTSGDYIPENIKHQVVYDSHNIFSFDEKSSLEEKIIEYEKSTTNEIVVLILDSIPKDIDILDFSREVGNSWGIGKKDKDNGLLITLAHLNRKVAISLGTGTEKTITDYECKIIIDSLMIPNFKNGQYYTGVNKAIDSLIVLWD